MNVQEILAQIDHAITEIDLVLHQWQEDLDMMSFIAYDVQFELWTNDDPPRVITRDVLSQAAGKELRVMHHVNGAWTQVGSAKIDGDGNLSATIDKDIPELRPTNVHVSLGFKGEAFWNPLPSERALGPIAHFTMREDGSVFDNVRKQEFMPPRLGKPLTIRGLEEAIAKYEKRNDFRYVDQNLWPEDDELLNDHPFFKTELWKD